MSFEAIRWALAQPIQKSSAKFLLVALADCVNEKSEAWLCWPSVAYLSETTSQDRKTVLAGMKYLHEVGYIEDTGSKAGRTKQIAVFKLNTSNFGPVEADVKESQISQNQGADYPPNEVDNSTEIGAVKEAQKRDSTDNGTVPYFPSNSTVFPMKESQISHERVPKTGHGTSKEPVIEPVKEPVSKRAKQPTKDCVVPNRPDDVTEQTWSDWLQLRKVKRAVVTQTVLDGARRESVKAGIPFEDFLQVWCVRGSQGLQAEWLKPVERQGALQTSLTGGMLCPVEELLDAYAEVLPMLAQPRRSLFADGEGASDLRGRWGWVMTANAESGERAGERMATTAEEGVAWFKRFFGYVGDSAFLLGLGGGRSFEADLHWLVKRDNFEKVLAGKYHREVVNAG